MEGIRKEKGVLKLVHPGRYIEIHRKPIIAEEVMRRNPRHCITRPDVFEFPWIVVKPQSLLLPGKVFFIVPNHTIYNLMKAKAPSPENQQFPHNRSLQDLKQTSLVKYSADKTTKHHQTHKQSVKCLPWRVCTVHVGPKVIKYKATQMRTEQQLHEESTAESRAYDAIEYQMSSEDDGIEMPKKDANLEFVSNEQLTVLKSCFRKPDSTRRVLDLKVSFDLPVIIEEDWEYTPVQENIQDTDLLINVA